MALNKTANRGTLSAIAYDYPVPNCVVTNEEI